MHGSLWAQLRLHATHGPADRPLVLNLSFGRNRLFARLLLTIEGPSQTAPNSRRETESVEVDQTWLERLASGARSPTCRFAKSARRHHNHRRPVASG
jgi:hypothetical protein